MPAVVLNCAVLHGHGDMTKISLQNGKVVFRDGTVVADDSCCEVNCCGGVARPPEEAGDCCGDNWFPAPEGESSPDMTAVPFVPFVWQSAECPEGYVYARWGQFGQCCGCIPDEIFDPRVGENVPTADVLADLCCETCSKPSPFYLPYNEYGFFVGCFGRCCADDDCSRLRQADCASYVHPTKPYAAKYAWEPFLCCGDGACNIECCDGSDLIERATFAVGPGCPGGQWVLAVGEASYVYTATAADRTTAFVAAGLAALVGSPFTAVAKASSVIVTGVDAGDGRITNPGGDPQPPVSIVAATIPPSQCFGQGGVEPTNGECPCQPGDVCCERATSNGVSLTFTKPAAFSGSVRVTVAGTVGSPILIHGVPVAAGEINHTFTLCYGTFNIEPTTCGVSLNNLNVKVCYEEEAETTESLDFSGCNGLTIALSHCSVGCVTTMTYDGSGHTSTSTIQVWGDATIEANGTGPLVLTSNITIPGGCAETLTLGGSSTAANEISGVIGNSASNLSVRKTGVGTWRLTGNSSYNGQLRVRDGSLIVGSVTETGNSPFGTATDTASLPRIGDSSATSGTAALLTTGTIDRGFFVESGGGSQVVVLGGFGAGFSRFENALPVRLGRDVTLQASNGGTVEFANNWLDLSDNADAATFGFVIGSVGNAGTVVLENFIPSPAAKVEVRHGTLRLDYEDTFGGTIWETTPVTVGDAGTSVTVIINGIDQPLSDLTLQGSGSDITGPSGGVLRLVDSPAVTVTGTGHEISAAVVLDDDATLDGTGSVLISGVVSGSSAVTMDGSGTVTLSGNNTYTGTTTINGGTLKAGSLTAFGTGDIVVNAGGTLDKNGYALANTITNNGGTVIN